MFWFFEKKIEKNNEDIYHNTWKEASIFFDKTVLTISGVFLWFLFSQIDNILKIEMINLNYLIYSIILIWIIIVLILFSYYLTIYNARLWYELEEWIIDYEKRLLYFKYNFFKNSSSNFYIFRMW